MGARRQTAALVQPAAPPAAYATPLAEFLLDEAEADQPDASLIGGMVPEGALSLLSADSEAGKTWLALDWGMHVVLGMSWLGLPVKQGRAVMVLEDDNQRRASRRVWQLGRAAGLDAQALKRLPLSIAAKRGFSVDDKAALDQLAKQADGAALVVIDPLIKVHNERENDAAMEQVMRKLDSLTRGGAAVLVLHHLPKPDPRSPQRTGGARGHTSIRAAARAKIELMKSRGGVLSLEATNSYGPATSMKLRLIIDGGLARFERADAPLKAAPDAEPEAAARDSELERRVLDAVRTSSEPLSLRELRRRVPGVRERRVDAAAGVLERRELIRRTSAGWVLADGAAP